MNRTTLYIKLIDKDTKQQKLSMLETYKTIQRIVLQYTDKFTIFEADWVHEHQNGTITVEKALKTELFDVSKDIVSEIIKILKIVLNHESILMQHHEIVTSIV